MDEHRPETLGTSGGPTNRSGVDSRANTTAAEPQKGAAEDLVGHATNAAGEVIEHAKSAADEVIDHAKTAAGETLTSLAEDVARQAPEIARQVRDQAGKAADDLYRSGSEYVSRQVETYPLSALVVAAAVGYGLGYLFSRRD